jgi:hypothetical protein
MKKVSYMNIWTKKGSKIRFTNPNVGYDYDIKNAKKYLKLKKYYIIKRISVGQSRTEVELEGIPDIRFNAIMFSNVKKR